jgi:hypothetical protein
VIAGRIGSRSSQPRPSGVTQLIGQVFPLTIILSPKRLGRGEPPLPCRAKVGLIRFGPTTEKRQRSFDSAQDDKQRRRADGRPAPNSGVDLRMRRRPCGSAALRTRRRPAGRAKYQGYARTARRAVPTNSAEWMSEYGNPDIGIGAGRSTCPTSHDRIEKRR